MKTFLKRWTYSYTIVNIVFLFLSIYILRNLNIQIPFLRFNFGAIIIAIFIGFSITIFKMGRGQTILKLIGGFLILLPIIPITKKLFGVLLFRFSIVIYILALIIGLTYSVSVFIIAKRSKKEEKELNELLNKKEE